MALIVIESAPLTQDQKTRIGERVITALQHEGIQPASVVVLFRSERGDMYLDGHFVAAQGTALAAPSLPSPAPKAAGASSQAEAAPAPKAKGRRSKTDLQDLKQKLMNLLRDNGSLSSFQAQVALKLKDDDTAPATLRRLFTELEEEKLIEKFGQKRGTRYTWLGMTGQEKATPPVKLVKAESDEA